MDSGVEISGWEELHMILTQIVICCIHLACKTKLKFQASEIVMQLSAINKRWA